MKSNSLTPQSENRAYNLGAQTAKVSDIMTTSVITTEADRPLHFVGYLLKQHKIHHLVVTEETRVIGVISDRDVLSAVSPFLATEAENYRDVRTMHLRASEIMTPDPICVVPTTTIAQAAVLLLRHNISCLPVTNADQAIQGIVTWKDLLWFYVNPPKHKRGGRH